MPPVQKQSDGVNVSHPTDLVRALAASEERLFELLEHVPVGVVVLAAEGKGSYANRAARELLGPDAAVDLPPLLRALAGETVTLARVEIDGPKLLEVSAAPLYDGAQAVAYAIATLTDVTETARLDQVLRESQRAYRDLFVNAPIGIYRTTPDGAIVMANPALVEMLGFDSVAELLSWHLDRDGVHADYDRVAFMALLDRFGEVRNLEGAWRRRDGTTLIVNENARLVRGANDEVLFYEGTVEDITARRETEEALRTSREAYRYLVENATDIMYSCDPSGRFTYVNPTVRTVIGYSEQDILKKHFLDIIDPEYCPRVEAFYRRQFQARAPNTYYEFPAITPTGERVWIGQNVQTLMRGGRIIGFQAVARDISERKKMEEELARTRDAAVESARLKSEFLANVSHEIRTPMNGVIGMADLLYTSALTTEQRDYAQTIRQSAESLLRIVDDILDISKIEAGKLALRAIDFDLDELIDEITDVFAERAAAKGIRFRSIIYPDVHRQLRGDALRIRQVVVNLVGNAIKFTPEGEVTLSVMQDSESDGGTVLWFLVNDTGIGISGADQERLFVPFVQVDGKTNRKFGGTGLGLAISKQLVSLLGGRIGVASVPGEGSTFWFTAPMEKDLKARAVPKRLALAGLRALVVDGDDVNRLMLRRHLSSAAMHVDEAPGVDEAMDMIRAAALSQPYDIVVSDMQLPHSDGLALTRAVRAEEFDVIARTPVVLITAIGRRKSDVEAFRASGVNAFIIKPVRQSQLASAVAGVIGDRSTLPPPSFPEPEPPAAEAAGHAPRILVVEDNVVNQKVAVGQLRLLGLDAKVAGSGAEAIDALREGGYDLVLLDCQMPDVDGYEVAGEIRRLENGERRIPIVAVTAYVLEGERERCLAAGMDDYLPKPVSTVRLAETLGQWIRMPAQPDPALDSDKLSGLKEMAKTNPRFMTDITTLFREDALLRLHDLRDSIEQSNAERLARAAHALKSSSGNVGAKRIYTLCAAIEENARAGSISGASALVDQLAAELDVAVAALSRSAATEERT
jgi:two-component system, sensor histidine kinase and response regulator